MVSLELVLCIFTITLFVARELDFVFLFVCSLVVILCRQYIQRRTSESTTTTRRSRREFQSITTHGRRTFPAPRDATRNAETRALRCRANTRLRRRPREARPLR